ncbi:MAG TPA: ribbon-helix-helix domain-containing protein [Steroidobacteraceae bacterium]|jgi:hypothetical protein|nr:ribbon-helix-helix domain-containing protein [Steroidobacteraceae bacterium]
MRAKKAVDFMAGLRAVEEREGVQRRPRPAPAPKTATATSAASEDASSAGSLLQPSRRGKVAITHWVDPAVRKQVAQLALDHDKSQAELVSEALNLLFEKYGKSPIAAA